MDEGSHDILHTDADVGPHTVYERHQLVNCIFTVTNYLLFLFFLSVLLHEMTRADALEENVFRKKKMGNMLLLFLRVREED